MSLDVLHNHDSTYLNTLIRVGFHYVCCIIVVVYAMSFVLYVIY